MAESTDRLNDRSDYQLCFACGARNAEGLGLVFHQENGAVVTTFTGDVRHQGFPGIVHGGIIATLLDETLERLGVLEGRWLMTGRLEMRFRRAAPVGALLRVEARVVSSRGRALVASGVVHLDGDATAIIADATGTFVPLPADLAARVAESYPAFARSVQRGDSSEHAAGERAVHRDANNHDQ
jgi:acyl-coenzyme A thioesterase PaaI-like protein